MIQQERERERERRSERSTVTSGFTIIEVALVLAIAGLIFLVVFVAWPALQNSQADTARRQDVNRVVSALEQYKVDHQGDLSSLAPAGNSALYSSNGTSSSGFSGYVGKLSQQDHVIVKSVSSGLAIGVPSDAKSVDVYLGTFCPGDTRTPSPSSDAAAIVRLSTGTTYCASM